MTAPTRRQALNVALAASGAIVDIQWQRFFYAALDAFLSAARSVPEIIKYRFGRDKQHREFNNWFKTKLSKKEQQRRSEFMVRLEAHYKPFRAHPLSRARDISVHRTGYAPVTVKVSGLFGVTYEGDPVTRVPTAEGGRSDPGMPLNPQQPIPLRPRWSDFEMDGQELFPACQGYLRLAAALLYEARRIADAVHGKKTLTSPPG